MPRLKDLPLYPLGWALRRRRSGEKHSALSRPGWDAPATITVTSSSFEHGGRIDDRHSGRGRGANLSPQLRWTGVPGTTRQLLLVFEDLDLPFDRPGLHTLGLLSPEPTGVEEGELTPGNPAIRWVPPRGDTRIGYYGPRPLPGHGVHHYRFHLIALDAAVPDDVELPGVDALDPYVAGHAMARGTLEGYQRG